MAIDTAILTFFGKVLLYGGGTVGIAYTLFLFLGKKWIEKKFTEQLEDFKHAKNRELEELRYKINALFNRVTKIHEKEFEVLPESWGRLQNSLIQVKSITSLFQQYPNLDRMKEKELSDFLSNSFLKEYEKDDLKNAKNKTEYYREKRFWYELNKVQNSFFDFHDYIGKNKIFLDTELKEAFEKIDDIMWHAIVTRKVGHESEEGKYWSEANKMIKKQGEPIIDFIASLIQKRLHYHDAD